jgi:multimeric flavodoxin WrbA
MSNGKVVVLDGCGLPDKDLTPLLNELLDVFRRQGAVIETFHLRECRLAHCIGCFHCWLKTPGMCVEDDEGRRIAKAFIQSDTAVLFTPVTFGGYAPDLKKMMERCVPLISPFFAVEHGEVHHPPRYVRRPRLIVIGVQKWFNLREARIFQTLAGRNAINLHPSSYASEVVVTTEPADMRRQKLEALLVRSDPMPFGRSVASLMPDVVSSVAPEPSVPKRALLIVGSPRTGLPSTSGILGTYVLERLRISGWETESVTLRAGIQRKDGEAALLESFHRAGLLLLTFPLYVDALPYLLTRALTLIAAQRQSADTAPRKQVAAIVNSGFPEMHQNAVALAICREFAVQSGISWRGGLAVGGGGMIGGQELTEERRSKPPLKHVARALELTAAALSAGLPVPGEAVQLMASNPMPFVPLALWRAIYMRFAAKGFAQQAAVNGITKDQLLARPYAA